MTPDPLLVYDGDCGFCAASLRRLRRTLPAWPRTSAWQTLDLEEHGLSPEQVTRAAWWIEPGKAPAGGARGFRRPAHLAIFPQVARDGEASVDPPASWAAELVYTAVSRSRHRLPGGTPMCSVRGDGREP